MLSTSSSAPPCACTGHNLDKTRRHVLIAQQCVRGAQLALASVSSAPLSTAKMAAFLQSASDACKCARVALGSSVDGGASQDSSQRTNESLTIEDEPLGQAAFPLQRAPPLVFQRASLSLSTSQPLDCGERERECDDGGRVIDSQDGREGVLLQTMQEYFEQQSQQRRQN